MLVAWVVAQALQSLQQIDSFETDEDVRVLRASNTRIEAVELHATDGHKALKIEFLPSEWPNVLYKPANALDWSQAGGLAVDVTNPSSKTESLSVRIDDHASADGYHHTRSCTWDLQPGKSQTLVAKFVADPASLGMRGLPPYEGAYSMNANGADGFDLHHIVQFQFFMHRPSQPTTLYLDNVRTVPPVSMDHIVDKFGQFTRSDWLGKLHRESELRTRLSQEQVQIAKDPAMPDRERFGGWKSGPQLKGTGFFRTERVKGKWWLVDPDGRLFFSFGIDTVQRGEGTFITGRENMFRWLPKPGDPLTGFSTQVSGMHMGPVRSGQVFNFYTANLYRKFGVDYLQSWRKLTLERLPAWGFNTIGNWSDRLFTKNGRVPYVATGGIGGEHAHLSSGSDYWGLMHDPFDPKFAKDVAASLARLANEVRSDPWCLGYFVDNELSWAGNGPDGAYGLGIGALHAAAGSPAKQNLIERLKGKHGTIQKLNAAWGTTFGGWDSLDGPVTLSGPLNDAEKADLSEFVYQLAKRYFTVVRDELKKLDPDHLYLGCRFAWHSLEEEKAAAEVCDVVSFNIYAPKLDGKEWDHVNSLNKPCIIGEFHFGALDRGMFHPGLVSTPNQKARAQMYEDYVRSVLEHPAFVGCHWFQYTDEPLTGRAWDGENYNIGFVSVTDTPYAEMVAAAKRIQAEGYRIRSGISGSHQ